MCPLSSLSVCVEFVDQLDIKTQLLHQLYEHSRSAVPRVSVATRTDSGVTPAKAPVRGSVTGFVYTTLHLEVSADRILDCIYLISCNN